MSNRHLYTGWEIDDLRNYGKKELDCIKLECSDAIIITRNFCKDFKFKQSVKIIDLISDPSIHIGEKRQLIDSLWDTIIEESTNRANLKLVSENIHFYNNVINEVSVKSYEKKKALMNLPLSSKM